jgi:hypothetical protein
MVAGWITEQANSIIERADHGFTEGIVYNSVTFHGLPRHTNGPRFREMLLKIDPESDVTKILEYTTFHGALTNTVGKAAGRWQDCDSAKITWFHFTRKSLEWCYGTRNTGDERVDALEVYKTFTPDIRDGTEVPGRLKLISSPTFRALLKVAECLELSTFKLERILRNGLNKAIDGTVCQGKITAVHIPRISWSKGK